MGAPVLFSLSSGRRLRCRPSEAGVPGPRAVSGRGLASCPPSVLSTLLVRVPDPARAVFVCSGCCHKHAVTQGLINNKRLFLRVLEAGNRRPGCQDWQFWERPFSGLLSRCNIKDRKSRGTSLIRALIPSWRLHPHDLIAPQRPHLLMLSSPRALGLSHDLCGGHIQTIAQADVSKYADCTHSWRLCCP